MAENLRDNEEELDDIEDDDEEQNWEDWNLNEGEGASDDADFLDSELLCLFCDFKYSSADLIFEHCRSSHHFDFESLRKALGLDFYASMKLINYIRSQVAQNICWSCEVNCQSKEELQNHLHGTLSFVKSPLPWESDMYLKPFMQEDPLLYSFGEDDEGGDESAMSVDEEEIIKHLSSFEKISIDYVNGLEACASNTSASVNNGMEGVASAHGNDLSTASRLGGATENGVGEVCVSNDKKSKHMYSQFSCDKVVDNERMIVNKSYFGSYGSFGIHREMLADKVRTDAYRQAIMDNPSLLKGAVVLDVGCGTGILSLFAAQAGASRVNAVDASDKMASVASQIAKDNGLLWNEVSNGSSSGGVIRVIHGMVEDIVESGHIQAHSVDVLVSEWMGYCLLYESMLSSVLVARDHWLKPGGAILPDIATMFVAGFGKGGTSLPFWENVYGINMTSVGNELLRNAAHVPIIDVVDGHDLVTETAVLQEFDLATMKHEEVDFTATVELEPKIDSSNPLKPEITKCYGVLLWFDTSFTNRFCKDAPTVLSTSPYTPKTHWSQTILTFHEPIALVSGKPISETSAAVGSDACPAVKLTLRISIARGVQHRSIDISLEMAGIGVDGKKTNWPVQIFNLC